MQRTMPQILLAIAVGASLGAIIRWWLSNLLNAVLPNLPLGTLAANLIGGYVIGLALAWFGSHPGLPPHWRALIITGFCGGLTTFSTFSGELALLLQQARYGWMALSLSAHVGGSLIMTLLGIATIAAIRSA